MQGAAIPEKDFFDIRTGERWTIRPNPGRVPTWLFDAKRRVPGTVASDYFELFKLLTARPSQRIGEVMACKGMLWERLLQPFFLGALNTKPEEASAVLARALVRKTFLKGGDAYRTRIAHPTLAAAFVDPALDYLKSRDAGVRLASGCAPSPSMAAKPSRWEFPDATIPVRAGDMLVMAVPPWVAKDLMPAIAAPDDFRSIVNAHFKLPPPAGSSSMLGVIGGTAEWIFTFEDRISVTVSGADAIVDRDRAELAATLWKEVCAALDISAPLPTWQIVKEKRATFAATPAQDAKRPGAHTLAQPVPGRRLDPDGPARHHRGGDPVRRDRGGFGAWGICPYNGAMNQLTPPSSRPP